MPGAVEDLFTTRKSSCVNARGIPPTAWQLLPLLSYPGEYPIPAQGVPHLGVLPILTWPGVPHPWPGSTPSWGTPSILTLLGVLHPWLWGFIIPGLGYPILGYLPILTWSRGTPSLAGRIPWGTPPERTWEQKKYCEMEMGFLWKGHGTSGSIMGWRWGTPTGCGLTNKLKQESPPVWMQKAYCPHCSKSWGVPTLARGYLHWPGGTYFGGYLPWLGVPTLARGTYRGQDRVLPRCEQTENIASRCTTYAGGKNHDNTWDKRTC